MQRAPHIQLDVFAPQQTPISMLLCDVAGSRLGRVGSYAAD